MTTPIRRIEEDALDDPAQLTLADTDLAYFLLNVGDGDAQVILLPVDATGRRRVIVVDAASAKKVYELLDGLVAIGLLPASGQRIALMIATHPHGDHIAGMPKLLQRYRGEVSEFWHPGYHLATASFLNTMAELDQTAGHPQPIVGIPTAGTVRYYGSTSVSVLSPAVALRNGFDTHGVDVNDASIAILVEYPANRAVLDTRAATGPRRLTARDRGRRLLLTADGQQACWSHVTVDFPRVLPGSSALGAQLARRKHDLLRADVLKVPHHASKHGTNLELVERVRPSYSLVSSVGGGGSYNFPHTVAIEALREALEPIATKPGRAHSDDWALGIHYTADRLQNGARLGSIAVVMPLSGSLQLWRFGDGPSQPLDLTLARRVH